MGNGSSTTPIVEASEERCFLYLSMTTFASVSFPSIHVLFTDENHVFCIYPAARSLNWVPQTPHQLNACFTLLKG
jgi:hypothetical protein